MTRSLVCSISVPNFIYDQVQKNSGKSDLFQVTDYFGKVPYLRAYLTAIILDLKADISDHAFAFT